MDNTKNTRPPRRFTAELFAENFANCMTYLGEKLNNSNYFSWRAKAEAAFADIGCWNAIDPGFGEKMTPTERSANTNARSFVLCTIDHALFPTIDSLPRAKEMWKSLEDKFADVEFQNIPGLLTALWEIKMKPKEEMTGYINRLNDIRFRLDAKKCPVPDNIIAWAYLTGLTGKYLKVKEEIEEWDPKTITTVKVLARLNEAERALKVRGKDEDMVDEGSRVLFFMN